VKTEEMSQGDDDDYEERQSYDDKVDRLSDMHDSDLPSDVDYFSPSGHRLVAFYTREAGFLCSHCDREFPTGTILFGCREDDYDLCESCLKQEVDPSQLSFAYQGNSEEGYSDMPEGYSEEEEEGSFVSEDRFAQSGEAQMELEDGCIVWQVLLKKESVGDKYGFVQANGKIEFESRLARKPEGSLDSDHENPVALLKGPEMLIVRRIHDGGLLARWNERVPELMVKPQDRIVSVNEDSTVEGMMQEIHSPRILIQMCRFPDQFTVTLNKDDGGKLGFRFERPQNVHSAEVRITEVLDEGCVMNYNRQQVRQGRWAYVMLPDMRIDRVNDVSGDAQAISDELKMARVVELNVKRVDTSSLMPAQVRKRLAALQGFQGAPVSPASASQESLHQQQLQLQN